MILGLGNTIPSDSVRQGLGGGGGGGGFDNTYSLAFDGVDDFVNAGSSIPNLETGDISFSAWVYPTSFSSYNYFLDSGAITTKKGIFAGLQITTGFVAILRKTGVTNTRCFSGWVDCGLTINNWYNIVGVFDEDGGTAGVGQLKLYVNGVLKATVDGSGQDTGTGYDLHIGKNESGFSHFVGNIDEVSLYNYPLTSGNITTIYNSGAPNNLDDLTTPPTAWYRMGDNGSYKSPQWLIPNNSNKDKVSNYSFDFDGVDDKVSISEVIYSSDFTFSFWAKPASFTNAFAFGDINSNASFLRLKTVTTIEFKFGGSKYTFTESAGNDLVLDSWQHLMFTRDGSNNVKGFRNGVAFGSSTVKSGNFEFNTIGADYSAGNRNFNGSIDEFAVWTTDQSANIATIYNSGTPTTLPSGAVAHWKMGEEANFTSNWLVNNSALTNYSTRSFNFDGVDDSLIGPEANLASAYTKASWSYWFNASSLPSSTTSWVYSRRGSNDNYGELWGINNLGKLIGNIGQSNALDGDYTGGTTISTGTWYNVVITYDGSGSTNDDKVKVYLNGNLETLSWTGTVQTELLQNLGVGRKHAIGFGGASYFEGKIDEVAVWYDTTLTSANAITIYNSGEPADLSSLIPNFINIRMGENATFSTNWNVPDSVNSPTNDFTSANMTIADLEGEAPNYTGGGLSNNMTIEDRVGNAPNSTSNALSYNMTESDRETDVPT